MVDNAHITSPDDNPQKLVTMGKIVGAFGIRGFVKIKTDNAQTCNSLSRYPELYLLINNTWIPYTVEKYTTIDSCLNAKLSGISDRDQAIALKGVVVAIPRDQFPNLAGDEYYWADLVGCSVYNKEGKLFGVVKNLIESGSNCVLVIKGTKEYLIPFVNVYVSNVDLEKKQITVDWGLDY